jgi:hypothetical protein
MPKLPPLKITDPGHHYGEDLLGDKICLGAKQGLPSYLPYAMELPLRMRLVRVPVNRGGYAPNGAYFGTPDGERLYHAESVDEVLLSQESWRTGGDPGKIRTARLFVTAKDRAAAKAVVRETLPNASFYR